MFGKEKSTFRIQDSESWSDPRGQIYLGCRDGNYLRSFVLLFTFFKNELHPWASVQHIDCSHQRLQASFLYLLRGHGLVQSYINWWKIIWLELVKTLMGEKKKCLKSQEPAALQD